MNINYLSSKILSNKKVIENFILLSSTKFTLEKLNIARTNLSSSKVKEVIEEYLPILASASKKQFVHGAIEWLKCIREIRSMHKRHRLPSFFITIAPNDINSLSTFCITFRSNSNKEFPAILLDKMFNNFINS